MNAKQFQRLLDRDGYCLHCGEQEAIAPNHRANRGMGGSKLRDGSENLVVLCSELNGLIESNAVAAQLARKHGWKLESWQNPIDIPVTDLVSGKTYLLNQTFGRTVMLLEGSAHERNKDLPAG